MNGLVTLRVKVSVSTVPTFFLYKPYMVMISSGIFFIADRWECLSAMAFISSATSASRLCGAVIGV